MSGKIITVSGASAVGKTFLIDKVISKFPEIKEIAGVITRPKREGEVEGQSNHYVTLEKFNELENNNQLMLIREQFGYKYGWLKDDLKGTEKLRIMNVSHNSIEELKNYNPEVISIFVRPSSEEEFRKMLDLRSMSQEEYQKRIDGYYQSEKLLEESKGLFDLVFINNYDEKSVESFINYIANELQLQYKQKNKDVDYDNER